jgi:hypothetical protein
MASSSNPDGEVFGQHKGVMRFELPQHSWLDRVLFTPFSYGRVN